MKMLAQKFLNYREDSRAQVAIEKLIMAMTRDVGTAISEVYMVGTALVFGCLFKIVALIGFVLFINANTDEGITGAQEPMIKVMIMPVLILIWLLKLRQKPGFKLRQAQFEKEESMINHVIKCVINYTLIADYDRRVSPLPHCHLSEQRNASCFRFSLFCPHDSIDLHDGSIRSLRRRIQQGHHRVLVVLRQLCLFCSLAYGTHCRTDGPVRREESPGRKIGPFDLPFEHFSPEAARSRISDSLRPHSAHEQCVCIRSTAHGVSEPSC